MSDSGSEFGNDPNRLNNNYDDDRDIVELIQEFDTARDNLLRDRPPNTPFNDLDRGAVEEYIRLVLCGQNRVGTQYNLQPTAEHRDVLADPEAVLTRDVDSALIFREDFPWDESYDILTTYDPRKSVRDYLHAQDPTDGTPPVYRDPGKDENVLWGFCGANGGRNRIYIMLPGVTDEQMTDLHPLIYAATLDTAKAMNRFSTTSWSPTYEAEMDRTTSFTRSRFRTESRKPIPRAHGTLFADAVISKIRRHPWGDGAYWFIQIRGAKDLTREFHFDRLDQDQLDTILLSVDTHQSVVYVDLGIEIHLPHGYVAMPDRRDESHSGMAEVLWGIHPTDDWDYAKYSPDTWAGVASISGFRINYAREPKTPNLITYAQVYTTDKFQTYNTSNVSSAALQVFAPSVLKMATPDDIPPAITKVYSATQTNLIQETPTATRFEARVPLHNAVRLDGRHVVVEDLEPFLIVVPAKAIWAWRLHRLYACYLLFKYAASLSIDAKRDPQYLTLITLSYIA
ncbi:hypothetical protein F5880DRAFT_1511130, partial [Lentinula raphanica]